MHETKPGDQWVSLGETGIPLSLLREDKRERERESESEEEGGRLSFDVGCISSPVNFCIEWERHFPQISVIVATSIPIGQWHALGAGVINP